MKTIANDWQLDQALTTAALPVQALIQEYQLSGWKHFPTADELNVIASEFGQSHMPVRFQAQSTFAADDARYYEEIIGATGCVPTRENSWHDLFNALVWMQFPNTKLLLNRLHLTDIRDFGQHPRTARRNRLTHFDECGIVLAVPREKLTAINPLLVQLSIHQWQAVFLEHRDVWGTDIIPFIFGHANFEMMLTPFPGLTGKWLAVTVPDDFATQPVTVQRQYLDNALEHRIRQLNQFLLPQILRPIPLLGIPGWHHGQTLAVYQNQEYFRPQRLGTPPTQQLPLN